MIPNIYYIHMISDPVITVGVMSYYVYYNEVKLVFFFY